MLGMHNTEAIFMLLGHRRLHIPVLAMSDSSRTGFGKPAIQKVLESAFMTQGFAEEAVKVADDLRHLDETIDRFKRKRDEKSAYLQRLAESQCNQEK